MKTITMLEFRRHAAGVLRRIANGEHLVLSHRGKPAARLAPIRDQARGPGADDPFLAIGRRATPSPIGPTAHRDIDSILDGRG